MDGVTILSEMSVRGEGLFFVIAWILLSITFIVGGVGGTRGRARTYASAPDG